MPPERRHASRYGISLEQGAVQLKVGLDVMPAQLVDASATGMAIRIDRHPGVYVGERVWLETQSGWIEACVNNVMNEGNSVRLGLTKLRQQPDLEGLDEAEGLETKPARSRMRRLLLGTALLVTLLFPFLRQLAQGKSVDARSIWHVISIQRSAEPEDWAQQSEQQLLYASISSLGPMALAVPDVAHALQLTATQQQEVYEILERTMRLQKNLAKSQPDNQAALEQLISHAQRQFLSLLTETQRQRFAALSSVSTTNS